MTTPLGNRIRNLIAEEGPISISQYMSLCLGDPDYGYYTTNRPIGAEGDFTTAPEVSQMFGELIGVWCIETWRQLGRPTPINLIELGPGRATLMKDLLRSASLDPAFTSALSVHLVEFSRTLQALQRETLNHADVPVHWHQSIASLAEKPGIFIANEFLDALPFHQFVKTGSGWRERVVATTQDQLTLSTGPATLDPSDLPLDHHHQPVGSVFETAPARTAIVETLASRLHRHAGAALIIDYGHAKSGFGDTFQAVHRHQFVSPLASPGKSDLTSHVDFDALSKAARSARCHVPPILTQGEFLLAMGLVERAGRLGSNQSVEKQNEIRAAVERLAGPQAMGNLFKVMAIAPQTIRLWPFEPILSPSGQS